MIKRIVEISSPCALSVAHGQLVVQLDGRQETVPVEDIGLLCIDSALCTLTMPLLRELSNANCVVVCCDEKHTPCSFVTPIEGNLLSAKILQAQIALTEPRRKRLWQSIVIDKIAAQARTLAAIGADADRVAKFGEKVRSGDVSNMEAQAARAYWTELFGKAFRRDRNLDGVNSCLNYSYAILRAAVARAIIGAGLCPALGVFHRNQCNYFALADDLVEPLRPAADFVIWSIVQDKEIDEALALDSGLKRGIFAGLSRDVLLAGRRYPLMSAMSYYAASFRKVVTGDCSHLETPSVDLT